MSAQSRGGRGGAGDAGRQKKKKQSGRSDVGHNIQVANKKLDASRTIKENVHAKPTDEQLRIAQITNSYLIEDPQMREKVTKLLEMTKRSEAEVCCALNECDNNLERALVYLSQILPVGAFETYSKKNRAKASNTAQDGAAGDWDWRAGNANADRREKSRNFSSNRGGTASRGWRGREPRERNLRETRGGGRGGKQESYEFTSSSYRTGSLAGVMQRGENCRGFIWRSGRGGGRIGGGGRVFGGHGDWSNGGYFDKQQQQLHQSLDASYPYNHDDNHVGATKDWTTCDLSNQTAQSIISGGGAGGVGGVGSGSGVGSIWPVNSRGYAKVSVPPGFENHFGSMVLGRTSSHHQLPHLNTLVGHSLDENAGLTAPMMQYSTVVSSNVQQEPHQPGLQFGNAPTTIPTQYYDNANSYAMDSFLTSFMWQNAAANVHHLPTYSPTAAAVNDPLTYANIFGSAATNITGDRTPLSYGQQAPLSFGHQPQFSFGQQPQVRRTRGNLPPFPKM